MDQESNPLVRRQMKLVVWLANHSFQGTCDQVALAEVHYHQG